MQIRIIQNKEQWVDSLNALGNHDVGHTYDYHHLRLSEPNAEPLAFVVVDSHSNPKAFWPVLRRTIPGSSYFDFTSVYGYSGPVVGVNVDAGPIIENIWNAMREFGGVSLFSRMNPLFINNLESRYRGDQLGEIVIIEPRPGEDPLSGYRGSHRREIIKGRSKGLTVCVEEGVAAAENFAQLYIDAMIRMDASSQYHFGQDVIDALTKCADFETYFMFCRLEKDLASASIFTRCGPYMHYFLSATNPEYAKLAPSKMIIAEAHRLAAEMGLSQLVLGGGLGASKDNLFAFKRGFSEKAAPFCVTRRVLDRSLYLSLCVERQIDPELATFFPAYRSPVSSS